MQYAKLILWTATDYMMANKPRGKLSLHSVATATWCNVATNSFVAFVAWFRSMCRLRDETLLIKLSRDMRKAGDIAASTLRRCNQQLDMQRD